MRIERDQVIVGISARRLRDSFRQLRDSPFSARTLGRLLAVDAEEASDLLGKLEEQGYVQRDSLAYVLTVKGNALSMANIGRQTARTIAKQLLDEFLARVAEVNQSSQFLYKVTKVVVFGSYLSSAEDLNDIDLAIQMEWKFEDMEERERALWEKIRQAESTGKKFGSFVNMLCWPQTEVRRYLQNRQKIFSIVTLEEHQQFLSEVPHEIIYTFD